jgi:hypothetical protein
MPASRAMAPKIRESLRADAASLSATAVATETSSAVSSIKA